MSFDDRKRVDPESKQQLSESSLEPLALRAREAARALGIGTRQLWTLTNAGRIPHVRIGRTILYPVTSLNEWLCRSAKGGK